jgi:ankyrin repeat protein
LRLQNSVVQTTKKQDKRFSVTLVQNGIFGNGGDVLSSSDSTLANLLLKGKLKMYCPHCEKEISDKAVACPHCGCAAAKNQPTLFGKLLQWLHGDENKECWNGFLMVLVWVPLAFFIPIIGWIMGGFNLNKKRNSEPRQQQAIALIVIASIGALFWLIATNDVGGVNGNTLQHSFAATGPVIMVKILNKVGADINAENSAGETPLHRAAQEGYVGMIQALIKAGANIDAKSLDGNTPLHDAVRERHVEAVKVLVNAGANINAKNKDDYAPLHLHLFNEKWFSWKVEIVEVLANAGADVNIKNSEGYTPLHLAASNNKVEFIIALIKAGANINAKNKDDDTPLINAARNGYVEAVQVLVNAGADMNTKSSEYGSTPLNLAALYGRVGTVQVLVNAGANVNAKNNEYGNTPLHVAVLNGHVEVVRVLVNASADINAKNNKGETPQDVAKTEEIRELLKGILREKAGPSNQFEE